MTFDEHVEIIIKNKSITRKILAQELISAKTRNQKLESRIENLKNDIINSINKIDFLQSEIKQLEQEVRTDEAVIVHQAKKLMGI